MLYINTINIYIYTSLLGPPILPLNFGLCIIIPFVSNSLLTLFGTEYTFNKSFSN